MRKSIWLVGSALLGTTALAMAGAPGSPTAGATPLAALSVAALEEGDTEWRALQPAAPDARVCDINFRGTNSSSRRVYAAWYKSESRIPTGWWDTLGDLQNPGTSTVTAGGTLRAALRVETACTKKRRYRIAVYYDSNGNGKLDASSDQRQTVYLPSEADYYSGGTTSVNMGDLYASFK